MTRRFDKRWVRVAIYYAIALGLSFLARVYWRTSDLSDAGLGLWGLFRHLFSGLGPFIGALVVWAVFRPERRMSFGGTFPAMGVAMLAIPAVVLGIIGVGNSFAIETHGFGVVIGVWIVLYAIFEETGWRGYLQDEFRDRPALLRYVIVGLFWYAWHFTYLTGHYGIGTEASNLIFLILASIGIGFVADRTHSIFAAAAFHVVGNILMTSAEFQAFIPQRDTRITVVIACVLIWLIMLRLWGMRDKRARAQRLAQGQGEA